MTVIVKVLFSNESSFVGKLMEVVFIGKTGHFYACLFFLIFYTQCSEGCFDNVKWGAKTSVRFIYNNNNNDNFVCEILVPF